MHNQFYMPSSVKNCQCKVKTSKKCSVKHDLLALLSAKFFAIIWALSQSDIWMHAFYKNVTFFVCPHKGGNSCVLDSIMPSQIMKMLWWWQKSVSLAWHNVTAKQQICLK